MPKTTKSRIESGEINLENLAVDYQAGILSISAIQKKHRIAHSSLESIAKSMDWKREGLEKQVREAARTKALREAAQRAGFKNPSRQQVLDVASTESAKIDLDGKAILLKYQQDSIELQDLVMDAVRTGDKDAVALLRSASDALRNNGFGFIKTVEAQRRAYRLDESQVTSLQVNLGLDSPVFAGLNLRAPAKNSTNTDDQDGVK